MLQPFKNVLRSERAQTLPQRFSVRHILGSLALLFFFVEIVTGVLLLAYYRPTAGDAFYSMGVLLDEVRLGWLVHSVHAWSAHLLLFFTILYLVQLYFTHAYSRPRGMSWVTAVLLLCVVFMFSFTGGLLPWDQYAYWSTEAVRHSIAGIPAIGPALLYLFWGGWTIGEEVLLRFYVIHVALLPWIAAGLLSFHLYLMWVYGVGETSPARRRSAAPLPEFLLNVLIAVLLLLGVLVTLATVVPPPLAPPADPLQPLLAVEPPWYFLPAYQLLRNVPGSIAALAIVGIFILLFLPPLIDAKPDSSAARKVIRWAFGLAAIAACLLLGIEAYLP